jgi:hypothetical protein
MVEIRLGHTASSESADKAFAAFNSGNAKFKKRNVDCGTTVNVAQPRIPHIQYSFNGGDAQETW